MAEALSNNAALVAMDLQSAKSRLLLRKLSFLRRQLVTDSMESGNVDVMALKSLIDDPESLCLVKECRDLEDHFGTEYTAQILSGADSCSVKEIQKVVCNIDREKSFSRYVWRKPPYIAEITSRGGSWTKIWDSALHLGSKHLRGLQNLARLMAHHGNGIKPCPLCEMEGDDMMPPLLDHVLSSHHIEIGLQAISQSPLTVDNLITRLVESDIRFV